MVKSKKNEFKLYDMDSDVQEWRVGNFQRGDSWRSDEIYRCKLCHTKTNNWQMGGWPGMGPRLICPGSGYKEHKHLTELFELYLDIEKDPKYVEQVLDYNKKLGRGPIRSVPVIVIDDEKILVEPSNEELNEIFH